ncbi:MAG: hypothetical protein ABI824_10485 [Acidobacteriota bacterium]
MSPESKSDQKVRVASTAILLFCLTSLLPTPPAQAAGLAVQRLSLHQYEDGPLIGASYDYLPGEIVWFTGRVTGYQREKHANADGKGEDERVRLAWTIRITDPAGVLLEAPRTGRVETTLLAEDKNWIAKFGLSFVVPEFAPKGAYRICATIKDEIAKQEIAENIPFHVRADDLPTATSLALLNFRFLAHEDDRFGIQPVVYHRGDTLFTRFDIVGYSFSDKNRFAVEYGITVLGPEGEGDAATGKPRVLLAQPNAAQEAQESFYPQRRVPAGFRLTLDADAPLGVQTMVVTVRDTLNGKTQDFRETFEVK